MLRSIRRGALAAFVLLIPGAATASCGSEGSCPVATPESPLEARLLFDVSQLYIDQNQPIVGSDAASVGAIPGHHDEVRTVNRVTNFRLSYRRSGWTLGATMPYINRTHEHIHHHHGSDVYGRWSDEGIGDLEVAVARTLAPSSGPRFRAGLGFRAPTGKQTAVLSEAGEELEPSARLGTGAWGVITQIGAEWRLHAPGKSAETTMPLRIGVAGRYNAAGVEDYRHGAEAQVHLDAEYPLVRHLALLLQSNYRVRAKNDAGEAGSEEEANTGGASVYVTPGLRYDALPGFSIYGLAQFPVWERVNGIQVVAESNLVLGISRSLF
jgi:hypothetical protein